MSALLPQFIITAQQVSTALAGAAVFFHSAAIDLPQPRPQTTTYGTSTRDLTQPSPVFSKARFPAPSVQAKTLRAEAQGQSNPLQSSFSHRNFSPVQPFPVWKGVWASAQYPEQVQPRFSRQISASANYSPKSFLQTQVQPESVRQPAFFRFSFLEQPQIRWLAPTTTQDLGQLSPYFAHQTPADWVQAKYYSTAQGSPEFLQPVLAKTFFPEVQTVLGGFRVTTAQVAEVLQSSFFRGIFSPPQPFLALFRPTFGQFTENLPAWIHGPQPNSQAEPAPQPTLYSLSTRNLDQPAPSFSRYPPPSVVPTPPLNRPANVLAQLQSPEQPQPVFSKQQPQAAVLPGTDFYGIGNQAGEIVQPWFAKALFGAPQPLLSRFCTTELQWPGNLSAWFATPAPPSVTAVPPMPVQASLAQASRNLDQPAPIFSKIASFEPPAVVTITPVGASLSWQIRELYQPTPVFSRINSYAPPPTPTFSPTPASLSWQIRNLDQPQPWFSKPAPAPSFLPPNLFGSIPTQGTEQRSPVFSRFPPPSVAPTPPPLRSHWFSAEAQNPTQVSPFFSHQALPSEKKPDDLDGIPDPIKKKKKVEEVRLPKGKSAKQELRSLWDEPIVPPVQLPLFDIPQLESVSNPDDDIIPVLLLLGML